MMGGYFLDKEGGCGSDNGVQIIEAILLALIRRR